MTKAESLMAKALGLSPTASAQDVDKAIDNARLHAWMNGTLGLPIDATGAEILATVGERLDAQAKALGLPAGSTAPQIEAARAEARKAAASSTAPAAASSTVERTLAEIRDRLPKPPTAEELAIAEENAAIDGLLNGTTPMGSVREPGQWST